MADAKRYHVDTAQDDIENLDAVLQNIATRDDHVRIVSVVWRADLHVSYYTIISETGG